MITTLPRLVLVALLPLVAAVAHAQSFARLQKQTSSVQTGPTTVTSVTQNGFGFSASIDGTATNPAPPNTVTLPNNGGTRTLTYVAADGNWNFEQSFATQAALNTAYPNGTYTFTFGGRNVSVPLNGDLYPAAPVATLSTGTFNAGGALVVDRTVPLTISIAFPTNFAAGLSRLAIDVDGPPNVHLSASTENSGFNQNTLSFTVPANTFVAGGNYAISLEANRILQLDQTSAPGFIVAAAYTAFTNINVTVAGGAGGPVITSQPVSQTITPGSTVVFNVTTNGAASFVWRRDGNILPNASGPTLVLGGANAIAGNYIVTASNATGSTVSNTATLAVTPGAEPGRLVNLAIRTNAGTGAQTLIVGFAVGGAGTSGDKPLLLRAIGPSLTQFGLTGVLADPVATVFQGSTTIATNDDWSGNAQVLARATQVAAFPLAANTSLDAALASSPAPGSYSMQITGKNNGTGIALAEIYDASAGAATATTPRLVNISARTQVGTGGDVLIAGFVVGGTTSRTVLIRAIGPTLTAFGVTGTLADPRLQLFSGTTVIRENDNWSGDGQLTNIGNSVGAFALSDPQSRDAILLVTLAPGSYTAQVSGVGNTTGVALVEVYEVP